MPVSHIAASDLTYQQPNACQLRKVIDTHESYQLTPVSVKFLTSVDTNLLPTTSRPLLTTTQCFRKLLVTQKQYSHAMESVCIHAISKLCNVLLSCFTQCPRYPLYYINPKHSFTSTIRSTLPHPLIFSEVTTTMIPKCWQDRYQTLALDSHVPDSKN